MSTETVGATRNVMLGLGRIYQWPGGFAMALGNDAATGSAVRCCDGHPTPEEARDHGLVAAIDMVQRQAEVDLRSWAARPKAETSAGGDA